MGSNQARKQLITKAVYRHARSGKYSLQEIAIAEQYGHECLDSTDIGTAIKRAKSMLDGTDWSAELAALEHICVH